MRRRINLVLFLNLFILFLALLGLCCGVGFSLVVVSGGHYLVGSWASHCSGFCCGAQGPCGLSSFGSWTLERRLSSCGSLA